MTEEQAPVPPAERSAQDESEERAQALALRAHGLVAERTQRIETLASLVAEAKGDREKRRRLDPLKVAAYAGFEPASAALTALGFTPPAPEGPGLEAFLQAIPGGKAGQVVAAIAIARAVYLVARRAVKEGMLAEDAATLAIEAAEGWLDAPSSEGELATREAAETAHEAHEHGLNPARMNRQPGDAALEAGYATQAAELAARAAYAPSEQDARVELLAQVHPASMSLINPDFKSDSPERKIALHVVQRDWILPAVKDALVEWALRPRS